MKNSRGWYGIKLTEWILQGELLYRQRQYCLGSSLGKPLNMKTAIAIGTLGTIKISLPLLYLWRFSYNKKYQVFHAYTILMFTFQSVGAWERGYDALTGPYATPPLLH